MKKLENKVAIVTGGSRGIGFAIAKKFASEGAHIAISHVNDLLDKKTLTAELEAYGTRILWIKAHAASLSDSENLMAAVIGEFGRVDILVNNAGITRDNLLLRMTEASWDEVMDTNLKSVFNNTKAAAPHMLKQRSGAIVNISSIVGMDGNKGQSNYAASKAGIIGFTKATALEFASRNVRVNAIAPGFIATDMTKSLDPELLKTWIASIPLQRAGTVEDVAGCALFLASEEASYITGQVIRVDGGMG